MKRFKRSAKVVFGAKKGNTLRIHQISIQQKPHRVMPAPIREGANSTFSARGSDVEKTFFKALKSRSNCVRICAVGIAGVMELADVADSKSVGLIIRVGSSPTAGTKQRTGCHRHSVLCLVLLFGGTRRAKQNDPVNRFAAPGFCTPSGERFERASESNVQKRVPPPAYASNRSISSAG